MLRYRYGFEWTFHLPEADKVMRSPKYRAIKAKAGDWIKFNDNTWARGFRWNFDDVRTQYEQKCEALRLKGGSQSFADECFRTLEVNTPIMTNLEKIEALYKWVSGACGERGITPHYPGEMSGGGHIHVSLPGKRHWKNPKEAGFLYRVFFEVARRPWLSWVFNDPQDDINAKPIWSEWADKLEQFERPSFDELYFDKNYAISGRSDTIEFRFFDAPRDWREQFLHIMFLERFLSWCESQDNSIFIVMPLTKTDVSKITKDRASAEFSTLLRRIGLGHLIGEYHRMAQPRLNELYTLPTRYRTCN